MSIKKNDLADYLKEITYEALKYDEMTIYVINLSVIYIIKSKRI